MTVSAFGMDSGIPAVDDDKYIFVHPSGTGLEINPGDWVAFSGQYGIAAHDGVAYFKASGAGIALDRNPMYDGAGRLMINTAVVIQTRGIFLGSASFSGIPNLGLGVFPDMTGSGIAAPSGATGLQSTWGTAAPSLISANPTGAPNKTVGQLVRVHMAQAVAGTGQLEFRLWPPRADIY